MPFAPVIVVSVSEVSFPWRSQIVAKVASVLCASLLSQHMLRFFQKIKPTFSEDGADAVVYNARSYDAPTLREQGLGSISRQDNKVCYTKGVWHKGQLAECIISGSRTPRRQGSPQGYIEIASRAALHEAKRQPANRCTTTGNGHLNPILGLGNPRVFFRCYHPYSTLLLYRCRNCFRRAAIGLDRGSKGCVSRRHRRETGERT
ncbi:hypothetical protein BJV82DRAFT_148811 [Fennellomyces sp. T-0311]|nr:hypothetical protein BJV82DRAFT_148811 [Fennellomyces sp. T-0311]